MALIPVGIVLAVVYVRTGWLTNTILLHSLSNTIATVGSAIRRAARKRA